MDDNQVTEIVARKIMGDRSTASTVVRVYRLGPIAKRTGTCEHCGSDFDWFPSQSARRFCTKECHYAWRRSRRSRTCSHCGVEFDGGKPDSMAQFCSREHAALHKRATVTCNGCGVKFTKQRCHVKATNYCSDECHKKANRERTLSREAGICQTCGGPTSKKSYRQCNGCVRGVSGKPQPVKEIPA
jgi:hypothetical protein